MNTNHTHMSKIGNEQAFTFLELLVSVSLASIVLLGIMSEYTQGVAHLYDHQIRLSAQVQAQAILQTMTDELRILGNGVPFDQANFQVGEDTLSDITVTYPIDIATSATDRISFRLNETGEVHLLTQTFDPAASTTIQLTEIDGLDVNDPIYLSNSVVSGDDGLYARIASINPGTNSITLEPASMVYPPGASFASGSICEEVPIITYLSANDGSGISRDSGFGSVLLGRNSTMTLTYLDPNGAAIALPLTETSLVNSLRAIRIRISVQSENKMKSGATYTATVEQVVGLRNLNYFF